MINQSRACVVALLFCSLPTFASADELLKFNSDGWKYYDGAEDPGKDWASEKFDDSKWKTGQAILGYGDKDQKTVISYGDNAERKRTCAYFRRKVTVKDPKQFEAIIGKLICDDGAVVYINGKEVHRHNMTKGEVKHNSTAIIAVGGSAERLKIPFLVAPTDLHAGDNIVAVRVHQNNPGSSDLAFDLFLEGTKDKEKIEEAKKASSEIEKLFREAAEQEAI